MKLFVSDRDKKLKAKYTQALCKLFNITFLGLAKTSVSWVGHLNFSITITQGER